MTLRLRWLPSPRIEVETADTPPFFGMGEGRAVGGGQTAYSFDFAGTMSVKLPSVPAEIPALITSMGSTLTALPIEPIEAGPLEGFHHALFHVPNFPPYFGGYIQNSEPRQTIWRGRTVWECAGWRITLDSVPDVRRLQEKQSKILGFAITHVGRLERVDGSPFGSAQTAEVLEKLSFMLSFVRGGWTSCMCPVAFGECGEKRWVRWDDPRVSPNKGLSWFSPVHPDSIGAVASGFFARATQPHWWDAITLSLNWYFEANENLGMIHSAVVATQNALETLAWTMFVEDGPVSESGFEGMPASDRIRLMLDRAGIPLGLPASLAKLTALAKKSRWKDGPHALTDLRNAIVHPKKRKSVGTLPGGVLVDAWRLGLWYLEMIFLWLFGYSGEYESRLDPSPMVGRVETVPWAHKGP